MFSLVTETLFLPQFGQKFDGYWPEFFEKCLISRILQNSRSLIFVKIVPYIGDALCREPTVFIEIRKLFLSFESKLLTQKKFFRKSRIFCIEGLKFEKFSERTLEVKPRARVCSITNHTKGFISLLPQRSKIDHS